MSRILGRNLKLVGTDLFFSVSIASFDLLLKELVEGCCPLIVVVNWRQREVEVGAKPTLTAFVVHEIFDRVREVGRRRSKAEIFASVLQSKDLAANS
jgi:hypothetical protein